MFFCVYGKGEEDKQQIQYKNFNSLLKVLNNNLLSGNMQTTEKLYITRRR